MTKILKKNTKMFIFNAKLYNKFKYNRIRTNNIPEVYFDISLSHHEVRNRHIKSSRLSTIFVQRKYNTHKKYVSTNQ